MRQRLKFRGSKHPPKLLSPSQSRKTRKRERSPISAPNQNAETAPTALSLLAAAAPCRTARCCAAPHSPLQLHAVVPRRRLPLLLSRAALRASPGEVEATPPGRTGGPPRSCRGALPRLTYPCTRSSPCNGDVCYNSKFSLVSVL
jgi:hypothetical protein